MFVGVAAKVFAMSPMASGRLMFVKSTGVWFVIGGIVAAAGFVPGG